MFEEGAEGDVSTQAMPEKMDLRLSESRFESFVQPADGESGIVHQLVEALDMPPQSLAPAMSPVIVGKDGIDFLSEVLRKLEISAAVLTHSVQHDQGARAFPRFTVLDQAKELHAVISAAERFPVLDPAFGGALFRRAARCTLRWPFWRPRGAFRIGS